MQTDRKRIIALALCLTLTLALLPKALLAHSHSYVPIVAGESNEPHRGSPGDNGHTHADCNAVVCSPALYSGARGLPFMTLSRKTQPLLVSDYPVDIGGKPEPPIPR